MTKNIIYPKSKKSAANILLLTGLLWSSMTNAQQSVNSSGGSATGNGGTVVYSIGQLFYTSNIGNNGSVEQGVQHVYEIFPLSVNQTKYNISLSAYPNPTEGNLTLKINDYKNEKMSFKIMDIQSKEISNGQITSQQTQINISCFPSAYFILYIVNEENKNIQSFKIIKK